MKKKSELNVIWPRNLRNIEQKRYRQTHLFFLFYNSTLYCTLNKVWIKVYLYKNFMFR